MATTPRATSAFTISSSNTRRTVVFCVTATTKAFAHGGPRSPGFCHWVRIVVETQPHTSAAAAAARRPERIIVSDDRLGARIPQSWTGRSCAGARGEEDADEQQRHSRDLDRPNLLAEETPREDRRADRLAEDRERDQRRGQVLERPVEARVAEELWSDREREEHQPGRAREAAERRAGGERDDD